MCESGTLDDACGSGGDSCRRCRDGFECSQKAECTLKDASRWDILAVSADVPKVDGDGAHWDSAGNLPDVYAKITVNGLSETTKGRTKTYDGSVKPLWYQVTAEDVLASDLTGFQNVVIELVDEDTLWDTTIAKCKKSFDEQDFDGIVQFDCNYQNGWTSEVETTVSLKLRWHQ